MSLAPYSRLDLKSGFHPKVLHLGNAAWGALLRLVAISNIYGTDGWVDVATVRSVCSQEDLAKLTARFPWQHRNSPMLELQGNAYLIHDFLEHNDSTLVISKRKEKKSRSGRMGVRARAKQVLERAPEQVLSKSDEHPVVVVVGVDVVDPETVDPVPEEPALRTPMLDKYIPAYVRGVSDGKGGPFAWTGNQWDEGELGNALVTFAKDAAGKALRGGAVVDWLQNTASDFAFQVTKKGEAQFYSAFKPKGFLKWLNENVRRQEELRVG